MEKENKFFKESEILKKTINKEKIKITNWLLNYDNVFNRHEYVKKIKNKLKSSITGSDLNLIYFAGKIETKEQQTHETDNWRSKWIYQLFDELIDINKKPSYGFYNELYQQPIKIINNFYYSGPFIYNDNKDYICSHGVLTETNNEMNSMPVEEVLEISLKQIERSDFLIVNLDEDPLESYGTIAEVAYAYAYGIPIFGIGLPHSELWFNQIMMDIYPDLNTFKEEVINEITINHE